MKIIVDTNIVFSAIVNVNSQIGDLILSSKGIFEFYTCGFLRFELLKHREKLQKVSKLSDSNLLEAEFTILKHLNFINVDVITEDIWIESYNKIHDIDKNDIDFLALTIYLNGTLWTGDKKLYHGLKNKDFNSIIITQELLEIKNSSSKIY